MRPTNTLVAILLRAPLAGLHAAAVPASAPVESPLPDAVRPPASSSALWYRQPAKTWEEALPIGNGHLGAMVYGSAPIEQIQFNENTVWTGQPHSYAHEGAASALPGMRRLLQEMRMLEREAFKLDSKGVAPPAKAKLAEARAKQKQAEDLGTKDFMSVPLGQKKYQPCGDLWLDFPHDKITHYRRWLDLDTAKKVNAPRALRHAPLQAQARFGCCVFTFELGHQFSRAHHSMHSTNALAAAPNVFPCLLRIPAKIHG